MSGRPTDPIEFWSETANYPAGTDPWSATPTVVQPTTGQRNTGHTPKTQVPAQWENAFKRSNSRYIDYVADTALLNWRTVSKDTSAASLDLTFLGSSPFRMPFWSSYHQRWVLLNNSTATKFYTTIGDDINPQTAVATAKLTCGAFVANGSGILFSGDRVGATQGQYQILNSQFSSIGTGTLPNTPYDVCSAIATSTGRILVSGQQLAQDKPEIWYTDNLGTSWTHLFVTAVAGTSQLPVLTLGHNGEIVCWNYALAGVTSVFYSTDNGATWTTINLPFDQIEDLVYSTEEDCYFIRTTGSSVLKVSAVGSISLNSWASINPAIPFTGGAWVLKSVAVLGSAVVLTYLDATTNYLHCMSWDKGNHGRILFPGYSGSRVTSNGENQFLATAGTSIQLSLKAAGVGSTGRAE